MVWGLEFASKYAYDYGDDGSDSESVHSDNETEEEAKQKKRRIRKADANLIAVRFDELVAGNNQTFAGEPIFCKECTAIMTAHCRKDHDPATNILTCCFCGSQNTVLEEKQAIPVNDDVTFLLEAPFVKEKALSMSKNEEKDKGDKNENLEDTTFLVYCIDVSGSMDTKIGVAENADRKLMSRLDGVKTACIENLDTLKSDWPSKRAALVTFSDQVKYYGDCTRLGRMGQPLLDTTFRASRFGISMRKSQSTPSQLKSASSQSFYSKLRSRIGILFSWNSGSGRKYSANTPAIKNQIAEPEDELTKIEDKSNNTQLPFDILSNQDKMLAAARAQKDSLQPVSLSHASLAKRILSLNAEGGTALGPALVFSIGLSSIKAGSQVILCTDGAANVGMGSIHSVVSDRFYEELADYAREQSVVVNVISMEGTDCKLSLLGKVADKTNGSLNIVDPSRLGTELKSILANRVVATNVQIKLIVNKRYVYVREGEDCVAKDSEKSAEELEATRRSVVTRDIGNANVDMEATFEYGMRRRRVVGEEEADRPKSLPFQLQVTFETQDGCRWLRVYTKEQVFTQDRREALENLQNQKLIWSHAAHHISSNVLESNVGASKLYAKQIRAFNRETGVDDDDEPKFLTDQFEMVNSMPRGMKAVALTDVLANKLFKGKRLNSKLC